MIYMIPECKHIFHLECLKTWFLQKNQEREQRCAFCNIKLDITNLKSLVKKKDNEIEMVDLYDSPIKSDNSSKTS